MHVLRDSCDEIYLNRIFDPDATVEHPWYIVRTSNVMKSAIANLPYIRNENCEHNPETSSCIAKT